jgi:hypothetical protein
MSILNNGSAASTEDKSPWVQPGFIAAAAVVALLVVLGIILAVTGGSGGNATDAAKPAPPPASAPNAPNADASVCGLDAGSQSIPTVAPKAVWKLRGTVAVPTAPATFGPGTAAGGVPSCFAHSPTGALFAMVNIQAAMGELAKQPGRYPIDKVLRMIAPGPGRDTLKKAAAKSPVAEQGSTKSGAQVSGFNVIRYESNTAVIDVAFAGDRPDTAGYVHGQSTLRWENGDWKLELAQNGGPFDAVQAIPNLTGYVPWRGL